jgi:hypothetical protein
MTIGTTPPIMNRIGQPYCGTKNMLTTPASAQLPRRRFGAYRHQIRNHAADADAGKKPQPEQLRQVARIGGGDGEHTEQQVGADQRGLAAIAVADPAKDRRAEQDADIVGAEHRAERAALDAPRGHQVRRRESDGADVVTVDQGQQNRPGHQSDLVRTEPALVEQSRDLNFRLAGHRFPQRLVATKDFAATFVVLPATPAAGKGRPVIRR